MTPPFIPGLELARGYYEEVVAPLVGDRPHSAALLGTGSEVLGFDTERSTDHGWGPRLLLLAEESQACALDAELDERLPETYRGRRTRFGWDEHPVTKRVEVTTLARWLERQLGVDPRPQPTTRDWLTMPQQRLLEVTAGAVFHDGLGELAPLRKTLEWYPDDVWLWLLGCQWHRLAEEEAFVGRTAEVGDEIGSRVVAARLVRDLMRLCLLLERRYAPYTKWLGTAFARLDAHGALAEPLADALAAGDFETRERALVEAFEEAARRQNALGIAEELDPAVRQFHSRPFRVLDSSRFGDACLARVRDPWLRSLPPIGSVDQIADSTAVLSYPQRARRAAAMYEPD